MTIAVTIENQDKNRNIEVIEKSLNRKDNLYSFGPAQELAPGEKRTFYCFLLRDLIVREQHPENRD